MVCHVTADPFFVACTERGKRHGRPARRSYTWTGSETDIIPEMVDAFTVAINDKVNGIACCMVDPKAFNAVTNKALSRRDSGNGLQRRSSGRQPGTTPMSYIGQDLFSAGVAVAEKILTYVTQGRPGRWHDQRPGLAQRAAPHGRRGKRVQGRPASISSK